MQVKLSLHAGIDQQDTIQHPSKKLQDVYGVTQEARHKGQEREASHISHLLFSLLPSSPSSSSAVQLLSDFPDCSHRNDVAPKYIDMPAGMCNEHASSRPSRPEHEEYTSEYYFQDTTPGVY
jgi:hypothetical protein